MKIIFVKLFYVTIFINLFLMTGCEQFVRVKTAKDFKLKRCLKDLSSFNQNLTPNEKIRILEINDTTMTISYDKGFFSRQQLFDISFDSSSCSVHIKAGKTVQVSYWHQHGKCENDQKMNKGCLKEERQLNEDSGQIIKLLFLNYL